MTLSRSALRARLRTPGIWLFTDALPAPATAELAARIESLGYSALWLPETVGRDPFAQIAHLATCARELVFATGIANIHHRHPGMTKQAAMTLAEQTGGRFVLGLGVSHAPLVAGLRGLAWDKPVATMRSYLAAMDASPYAAFPPTEPPLRLLAALGPKMLGLSAAAADGAHPYWTTPEHTAQARSILGPEKLLCVEQKVVVTTDASVARTAAAAAIGMYASLPNYRNNWKRLGFREEEIEGRAPRFVDAVVAWGSESAVRDRIRAHYDAGADHVCIQPLPTGEGEAVAWKALEALAPR